LPLARAVLKAWSDMPAEERQRLCNGWTLPSLRTFPGVEALRRHESQYFDDVDAYLELNGGAGQRIGARQDFHANGQGTQLVSVLIRSCTAKADAIAALQAIIRKLDLEWAFLNEYAPRDFAEFGRASAQGQEKRPAGAGDEPTAARESLAELLGGMGQAGEKIAAFVASAIHRAPGWLQILEPGDPDSVALEVLGSLELRRDSDAAVTVKVEKKKASATRRIARKVGGKGGKRARQIGGVA
jgi:hypothetical protein